MSTHSHQLHFVHYACYTHTKIRWNWSNEIGREQIFAITTASRFIWITRSWYWIANWMNYLSIVEMSFVLFILLCLVINFLIGESNAVRCSQGTLFYSVCFACLFPPIYINSSSFIWFVDLLLPIDNELK